MDKAREYLKTIPNNNKAKLYRLIKRDATKNLEQGLKTDIAYSNAKGDLGFVAYALKSIHPDTSIVEILESLGLSKSYYMALKLKEVDEWNDSLKEDREESLILAFANANGDTAAFNRLYPNSPIEQFIYPGG